jgi:hypothetical protein
MGGSLAGVGGSAIGGAFNQAGTSATGFAGLGGNGGATSGGTGAGGKTASGGSGAGAGRGGASGQGGTAGQSGTAGQGGTAGATGSAGAAGLGNGLYCAPCVGSADCAPGALCVGGLNPRCGKPCSADSDCTVGTAQSTCEYVGLVGGATPVGGGASPPIGAKTQPLSAGIAQRSCTPSDAVCGTGKTSAALDCSDTWDNYANDFFATTCIGTCHHHDTTFTTVDLVRRQADAIRSEVESGAMPQDRTLPDADRRRLLTWLACGAP